MQFFVILGILGFSATSAFDPISVAIGAGSLWAANKAYNSVKCSFSECCDGTEWIQLDARRLENDLRAHVFGQHIAVELVRRVLRGHARQNREPKKALVLSFEGSTGSGKNYFSDFIAKNLFKLGTKSQYYHKIIATQDYPLHGGVDAYKYDLQNRIMTAGRTCNRCLFIFDEMDKMPPGLIDVLYPFVDYHEDVGGVDFRRSTFIFLSNSRADQINKFMLDRYQKGVDRERVGVKELDHQLGVSAFNEKGALWHSRLIKNHLIDYFVPFLPLERRHVKQCVLAEMSRSNMIFSEEVVNAVADELVYWPREEKIYSSSGCKKVRRKLDYFSYEY